MCLSVIPLMEVYNKSLCKPRELLVEILQEYPEEVEHIFIPSCVVLTRCAGCCNDEIMQCTPTSTYNITMEVSLFWLFFKYFGCFVQWCSEGCGRPTFSNLTQLGCTNVTTEEHFGWLTALLAHLSVPLFSSSAVTVSRRAALVWLFGPKWTLSFIHSFSLFPITEYMHTSGSAFLSSLKHWDVEKSKRKDTDLSALDLNKHF